MKKIFTLLLASLSIFSIAQTTVFSENFNSMPTFNKPNGGWVTTTVGMQIYSTHGTSNSNALIKNLNTFAIADSATSPSFTITNAPTNTVTCSFNYRIVNSSLYPSSTPVLGAGDVVEVSLLDGTTNATVKFFQITGTAHTSTLTFASKSFTYAAGTGSLKVKVKVKKVTTNDYFVDIDDILVTELGLTTNINTFDLKNGFTLSPNPVKNALTVKVDKDSNHALKYAIIDLTGKKILDGKFENTELDNQLINTSNLENGLYFVICYFANEKQITKKIVINK